VLASPARRVAETLAGVEQGLGRSLGARSEPAIYEASPGRLLGLVAALPDEAADVLIVGHQPALQSLLLHLGEDDEQGFRQRAAAKYPTAALAVIELPIARWADAGRAVGEVSLFVTPRELLQ
jgi:phosphohistidine phosphatase